MVASSTTGCRPVHGTSRRGAFCAGSLLLALISTLPLAAAEVLRTGRELTMPPGAALRIEATGTELVLDPDLGDEVACELVVSCSGDLYPCEEAAEQVTLRLAAEGGEVILLLENPAAEGEPTRRRGELSTRTEITTPRSREVRTSSRALRGKPGFTLTLALTVRYPVDRELAVRLGSGAVRLDGLQADASFEIGEGSATVTLLERDAASVELASKRGRVRLELAQRPDQPLRRPFDGSEVSWSEGGGTIDLEARVGRGEILVQLF